ncbi:alpha-2Da adrenergic receptor-like [Mya arenaria]|uniref:alpha-2Da adrenergic receptor-like n=1 Tax=Mya arenaria TaxID=6604 RepID=UPI0022E82F84|nr:alpha-2Da adrenergic receptor-like [Mya arenaria]
MEQHTTTINTTVVDMESEKWNETFDASHQWQNQKIGELNTKEVTRLIPLIVFLLLIAVTGIVGNGLVCYIYRSQYSVSSSRWFIFFLAVVDLLMCILIIPCEIGTLMYQFNFSNAVYCKISVFFNLWSLLTLGLTLLVVSVDRFRKVCKPLGWQINSRKARILCIIAICASFVLSLPALSIYGIYEIEFEEHNVVGKECSFRDSSGDSISATLYIMFGMAMFISALVSICVLYCFIGKEIKHHIDKERVKRHISLTASMARKSRILQPIKNSVSLPDLMKSKRVRFGGDTNAVRPKKSVNFDDNVLVNINKSPRITQNKNRVNRSTESLDNVGVTSDGTSIEESSSNNVLYTDEGSMDFDAPTRPITRREKTKSKRIRRARAKKATFSMFLISIAFVLSYCPFLCLLLARSVMTNLDESLSDASRAVYKFFLRSYFLNCAINPFIYGMSDSKFRESCSKVVQNVIDRLKCSKRMDFT